MQKRQYHGLDLDAGSRNDDAVVFNTYYRDRMNQIGLLIALDGGVKGKGSIKILLMFLATEADR